MNKHFKTKGIIIRKINLNEADRIVTVLTEDYGKIDCIAKGARRLKSKFCGRLELFYQVQLTCFQGRMLATINEINLLNGYVAEKDAEKYRVLFYIAEITNKLIQCDQHIEGAYPLLCETLEHLGNKNKHEVVLHAYLIKLLTFTGFLSPWNRCAKCNDALNLDFPAYLSRLDSNVSCQNCSHPADEILSVPLIKWVNFMQNYPIPATLKVRVGYEDHRSVWFWIQGILEDLLGGPVKSEAFLQKA